MKADEPSGQSGAPFHPPSWGTPRREGDAGPDVPPWGTPPQEPEVSRGERRRLLGWRRSRTAWVALAAAAVVGAGVAVAITEIIRSGRAPSVAVASAPNGQTPPNKRMLPATGAWKDIDQLTAGDCAEVDFAATDNVAVFAVPCGGAHNEEVVGTATLKKSPWPGQDAVDRASESVCRRLFKNYVGVEETASALNMTWYGLSQEVWSLGDREVICVVDDAADTPGSVKGSRR